LGGFVVKLRVLIGALSLILSSIVLPTSAHSAEYSAYSAACSYAGNSSFTAVKRGFYSYVWRTGSTVNGGGVVYLRAGNSFSIATPIGTNNTTRFGVVTSTSTAFAYIFCS
jgi:hypothetical protein